MKSDRWMTWLIGLALLLGAGWWWQATEWHEDVVPLPLRGEAATDRWYSVQRLARAQGVQVQRREQFDTLPPPDATLLMASTHWALFPGRATALRRWVEGGGHLVLTTWLVPGESGSKGREEDDKDAPAAAPVRRPSAPDDASLRWLPLRRAFNEKDSAEVAKLRDKRPAGETTALCRAYTEPPDRPGAYGAPRGYQVCDHDGLYFQVSGQRLWSIVGPAGPFAVTVQVGQGRVTAIAGHTPYDNRSLLDGDHGLVTSAALNLRAGRTLWLVIEERRPPLLLWLWQHAQVALPLALLALGLALWRAGLRFGPLVAAAPATRRAVTEQVKGTASYLARHGGAALRAAQQRALHEAAAARLAGYQMLDAPARAHLLARHTGLDAAALAQACGPAAGARALATDLQLLETARRRLLEGVASPASHPETRHADRR